MTVAELIEKLKELPQDIDVMYNNERYSVPSDVFDVETEIVSFERTDGSEPIERLIVMLN